MLIVRSTGSNSDVMHVLTETSIAAAIAAVTAAISAALVASASPCSVAGTFIAVTL
jgi:hypothetical protein